MRTGDLYGSGTVSGAGRDQRGSLLELSWGGAEPLELGDGSRLGWPQVQATVDAQQRALLALVNDVETGRVRSSLAEPERFALVLGITCHAVYHAGQIQLIKRLKTS